MVDRLQLVGFARSLVILCFKLGGLFFTDDIITLAFFYDVLKVRTGVYTIKYQFCAHVWVLQVVPEWCSDKFDHGSDLKMHICYVAQYNSSPKLLNGVVERRFLVVTGIWRFYYKSWTWIRQAKVWFVVKDHTSVLWSVHISYSLLKVYCWWQLDA